VWFGTPTHWRGYDAKPRTQTEFYILFNALAAK
jgi:hypothetical protein